MSDQDQSAGYVAPSRKGKVLVGGHFDPEIKRRLKMIAAAEDTTVQALLDEAIEMLLSERGE